MKTIFLSILLACSSVFFITSCFCKKKTQAAAGTTAAEARDFAKEGYVKATVVNYTVDGCTFLLQLEDGKKLEPTSLPADFKKDKLLVWIKYSPKKYGNSVCMAGQMVDVGDIQVRK